MSAKKASIASALVLMLAAPFVAVQEGVVLTTYQDPVGIPTVCAGETGEHVRMGLRFTSDECAVLLGASLQRHAQELDRCIKAPLLANEAAAVLSWGYNVGTANACQSTLVKLLNAGKPPAVWCAELSRWVYAKGIKLNGLVNRRAKERAMCEGRA